MKSTVVEIPFLNLGLSFIPVFLLFIVFYFWDLKWKSLVYATARMLSQLLLIGYFLIFIFELKNVFWTFLIVLTMLVISAWIALYSIHEQRTKKIMHCILSMLLGAFPVLILVTAVVIPSEFEWYRPSFLIPLTGMVFSNSMNTIGIAAERFRTEVKNNENYKEARRSALSAALIPQINSFFAVGLVALPGMMTGQILSGVDPLIAVRYQIVVMTMVMGGGGLSAAVFLTLSSPREKTV